MLRYKGSKILNFFVAVLFFLTFYYLYLLQSSYKSPCREGDFKEYWLYLAGNGGFFTSVGQYFFLNLLKVRYLRLRGTRVIYTYRQIESGLPSKECPKIQSKSRAEEMSLINKDELLFLKFFTLPSLYRNVGIGSTQVVLVGNRLHLFKNFFYYLTNKINLYEN